MDTVCPPYLCTRKQTYGVCQANKCVIPVSYTHLDVYKRQVQRLNKSDKDNQEKPRVSVLRGEMCIRDRHYTNEALNPRIVNPVLQNSTLIATRDRVPCTIQLSPVVAEAYRTGALPLNTLANAVLAKSDQLRQPLPLMLLINHIRYVTLISLIKPVT